MSPIPPKIFQKIRRIQIAAHRLAEDFTVGAYRSAFRGRGREFEEVREYIEGDDVRNIDWNVTARNNHPYVKIFREERELTVMLVVDISASLKFGTQQVKNELAAEIGALLAFTAIKNNDKVGLLLFSDIVERYIPPKKGVKHILMIIRDLLFITQSMRHGSNPKPALDFLGKIQKKSCICFFLSDFLYPLHKRELAIACKRHDFIAIHLLDPAERSFPRIGLVAMKDLEGGRVEVIDTADDRTQIEHQKRATETKTAVKQTMEQLGGGYIFIKTDESYVDPISQFFRMRRIKH